MAGNVYICRHSDTNYLKKGKTKTRTPYCKNNYIHQINYKSSKYLILYPFLLTTKSICLFINPIVLSTLFNVVLTRAGNSLKPSRSTYAFKASWCNSFLTMRKIFPTGLRPRLHAGIENFRDPILPEDLQLFCDGSPSCKNNFPFELGYFLNMLGKCSQTKDENASALILPKYCTTAITPFPYVTAAIKRVTRSFVASLCSETKIKSLTRFYPRHSSWSPALIKSIHLVVKIAISK